MLGEGEVCGELGEGVGEGDEWERERERGRRAVRGKREILRPRMDCGGLGSGEPRREKARN